MLLDQHNYCNHTENKALQIKLEVYVTKTLASNYAVCGSASQRVSCWDGIVNYHGDWSEMREGEYI